MIHPQFLLDLNEELIVDNFAGGGGASTGIEKALRRHVDHAINHDGTALGMHRINHPQTIHHHEDIFDIHPAAMCEGRPIGLAHFSPDCRDFSKAKGGKPLDKKIRGLVLVMLRYAKYGARVMTMENVEEITGWGPLIKIKKKGKWEWHRDPAHKGRTWKAFLACLSTGIEPDHPDLPEILSVLGDSVTFEECVHGFGYKFEVKEIRACNLGAPTIRKRLYMIARRDGRSIIWPEYSHVDTNAKGGEKRKLPWRTIAECIDWTRPCPSIFLSKQQAKALKINCKRPLAPATLRRIAMGIDRYVLRSKRPFLVNLTHQGGDRIESVDRPANTITGAHRGEKELVATSIQRFNGDHPGRADSATRNYPMDGPLSTADTSNRFGLTEATLAAPFVTEHANASSQRNMPADEPARTICGEVKGGHLAAVSAHLMVNTTEHAGGAADAPGATLTTGGQQALITGTLIQTGYGEAEGQAPRALDIERPLGTIVGSGKHGVVTGILVGAGGPTYSGKPKPVDAPMNAQTTENHSGLVTATLVGAGGRAAQSRPRGMEEPMHTTTSKGDTCIATATLIHTAHGEQDKAGNLRRGRGAHSVEESMPSILSSSDAAIAMLHLKGDVNPDPGNSPTKPALTITAGGEHLGVIAAHITKFRTGSVGADAAHPSPTITSGSHRPETRGGAGGVLGAAVTYLAQHNAGNATNPGHPADAPASTISTTGSQQQVVAASIASYFGSERDGQAVEKPGRTISTKPRKALVESTAVSPMTPEQIESAHRVAAFLRAHGVKVEGEFATVAGYVIIDIGMRMLMPRELFRAQGFPERYIIDQAWIVKGNGEIEVVKLTKEQQIRMCGNSVCPDVMAALTLANVPELAAVQREKQPRVLA